MMSTLRPTAPEFVPSWLAHPAPPPPAPAAVDTPATNGNGAALEGGDSSFWGDAQWQDIPMADALALLACWFPSYSQAALQAIYEVNNKDLHLTLQDLCNIQAESDAALASAPPPPPPTRAPRAPRPQPKPAPLNDDNFPTLGGPAAAAATPPRAPLSFASIVKKQAPNPPAATAAPAPTQQPKAAPAPAAAAPAGNGVAAGAGKKEAVPWLETGEAVGQEYAAAREDARDLARVRNACFQQATLAYMAGNKALAKELSEKGRRHNEAMKAAHAAASAAIFRSRNKGLGAKAGSSSGASGLVDLHGLHVAEATALLDDLLVHHPSSRSRVLLCVGTGHHTKGARTPARLPQAVEAYLTRHQLVHRYLQPGLLEVQLRR